MGSVSIAALAFMLVIATATAYPVQKKKLTNQADLIKAFKMGKDQHAEAMDLLNKEAEKDQNNVYAMRDDGEDGVEVEAKIQEDQEDPVKGIFSRG